MPRAAGVRLSKKRLCRFFEKASLRSAPLLSADSGQFDAHSAQSVFCHAHVAAENKLYCFRVCGRETLRGFFDILSTPVCIHGRAETVEKVALPLFRESFAAFCASVVRRKRTIRRSLRAKCFPPRTCRGRKRIILLSRLRTRNSARLFLTS